jgi:phosphate:Na+ symporter
VTVFLASDSDRPQCIGRVLIGLGLLTLALQHLRATATPIAGSETFMAVLKALSDEPILAAVLAAGITFAAHSSLAIVLVIASLALSGAMTPTLAVAAVLGANVGAAASPLSAHWGAPAETKRIPFGNMIMRGIAAALLVPASGWIAAQAGTLGLDAGRLAVDVHLAFNILVAVVFLPFVGPLARYLERLIPTTPVTQGPAQPKYLDTVTGDSASEALATARREALALGDQVEAMLRRSMDAIATGDPRLIRELHAADDAIDAVNHAIKLHLVRVSRKGMSEVDSRRFMEVLSFTTNLEHIGDVIDKQLLELAHKKERAHLTFSAEGLEDLKAFHARVVANFSTALNVFATGDVALARRLFSEKTAMREFERQLAERHYARLRAGNPSSIETTSIHMDVLRDLKRIHGHFVVVAQPILEANGELADTRLRPGVEATPAALHGSAG